MKTTNENIALSDSMLKKIRDFADQAHGDQLRKYTPERYIVHPERVMETCRKHEATLPMLAAALLHDVLEDTETDREQILEFLLSVMDFQQAQKTLALVIELTDVYDKKSYPQLNRNQRKQKEIERLASISPDAQTIKYADIVDNSKEIAAQDPGFAPRFLNECLQILQKADKGNAILRDKALQMVCFGLNYSKGKKQNKRY